MRAVWMAWMPAGSSPRMRGAHVYSVVVLRIKGIIPADAGSTRGINQLDEDGKDHPRGCGEHHIDTKAILASHGSSPRMRGAP